ncbi:restriction endonuclease subunit S [Fodinibacter luteus]|uniref:Restriction endonuclease subunit S n=1 Tax=Fodinibacter luteus TaxID=552064 RepID=A0ABP8KP26_9MICO
MSEWATLPFGELYREPSRNGISVTKASRGEGVPMVNMKELFANDFISGQYSDLVPLTPAQLEKWGLEDGDLLFGRRSLTLAGAGKVAILRSPPHRAVFESSMIRARLDGSRACPQFYFYLFRSRPGRQIMETIVEQVAVAGIRSSDLARLKVPVPPLGEQRRIAAVLGAMDDLIESNRAAIANLRAMGLAAYEAASDGGDVVRFAEVAALVREGVRGDQLEGGTPYVGLEHFGTEGAGITDIGDAASVDSGKSRFRAGDVLYGKLRPYFQKVDRPGFDGVCSTELWVLRPTVSWGAATLHAIVARPEFTRFAMAGNTGTRMPRANWAHVASMPVPVPPAATRTRVDRHLDALWRGVVGLSAEVSEMTNIRDSLLPLLISGQVQVNSEWLGE